MSTHDDAIDELLRVIGRLGEVFQGAIEQAVFKVGHSQGILLFSFALVDNLGASSHVSPAGTRTSLVLAPAHRAGNANGIYRYLLFTFHLVTRFATAQKKFSSKKSLKVLLFSARV